MWLVYWGLGCCQYQTGDGKAAIASFEQSLQWIDLRQRDLRLPVDGSTIVIESHCSLLLVPFAALQLADGTWMGDRWSLIYAPSAQTLEKIRQEPSYAPMAGATRWQSGNTVTTTGCRNGGGSDRAHVSGGTTNAADSG